MKALRAILPTVASVHRSLKREDGAPRIGRPPKADPIVFYGASLHRSQVDYLMGTGRPAEALREAVALHREKFEPGDAP